MTAPTTIRLRSGAELLLRPLHGGPWPPLPGPFAVLLPAFDATERAAAEASALALLDLGCVQFCAIGPEAEILHDALDAEIEQRGLYDVVTTWHQEAQDACEYFLAVIGPSVRALVALVATRPELAATLQAVANEL